MNAEDVANQEILQKELLKKYDTPRYKADLKTKDPKEVERALLYGYYDKRSTDDAN